MAGHAFLYIQRVRVCYTLRLCLHFALFSSVDRKGAKMLHFKALFAVCFVQFTWSWRPYW